MLPQKGPIRPFAALRDASRTPLYSREASYKSAARVAAHKPQSQRPSTSQRMASDEAQLRAIDEEFKAATTDDQRNTCAQRAAAVLARVEGERFLERPMRSGPRSQKH